MSTDQPPAAPAGLEHGLRLLRPAVERGLLRPADLRFAQRLLRLAGRGTPLELLAAALVSRQVGDGHVCLDLWRCADQPLWRHQALVAGLGFSSVQDWLDLLRASPLVTPPGGRAPLVLDADGRLYLARYWWFEARLAAGLRARAGHWAAGPDRALLRAGLARLFPAGEAESVDWQRVAAALAVLRPFCVICGGPGTGKTHTVAAILALLLEQAGARPLRVALAAPTGKAAGRLRDAIHAARPGLDISPELAAGFPDEALTLHRLLGFRPGRSCPRYGPQEPLSADLVVVDEASMVDLPMMARLVDALPANARLILLGDRDQLASVAPGMVLADIAGRNVVAGYSPRLRQALAEVGAASLEQAPQVPARLVLAPLADHVVLLRRSWRFAAGGALGVLAQAINSGNPDAALAVLQQPGGQVQLLPPCDATLDQLISMLLLPAWRQVLAAADPQAALVAAARVRLLAAVREGPWGVVALNRRVERALAAAGLLRGGGAWYAGRPVMVTVNDHAQNLYNGDVGMALPDAVSAAPRVWFASGAGVRSVPPARLPPHETVYAMTVHKSQGSEFQQVVLVLPPAAGASVTRELLYTAVTRARDAVTVVGTPEVFAAGVEHRIDRSTGLQAALWGTGVVSGPSPG